MRQRDGMEVKCNVICPGTFMILALASNFRCTLFSKFAKVRLLQGTIKTNDMFCVSHINKLKQTHTLHTFQHIFRLNCFCRL